MTDQELQAWVEDISLTYFGQPFRHRATFNGRLRTTGGRYFTRTHNIEISRGHYEAFGRDETESVIKHELCHYHLHLAGRGYRHRDEDFRKMLKLVGGSRYCQSRPGMRNREPYRYALVCVDCGERYLRKRKADPGRYACGRCRGRLRLFQVDLPPET